MSENYLYNEGFAEEAATPARMDRRLKGLIIALSLVLGGELIWLLIITPCMPFSVIDIDGIPELDRASLLAAAGVNVHSSYMTLNTEEAEEAISKLCQVASVQVTKQFPDTLKIFMTSRQALAQSLVRSNGAWIPVFFDKEGVIFAMGTSGNMVYGVKVDSLPIISGFHFKKVRLGMRLPAMYLGMLSSIARIREKAPELLQSISEIHIVQGPYDNFDLEVYPLHYPIKVLMGSELTEDQLRYMLLLIDVFRSKGMAVKSIDFRTGTASYTLEGEGNTLGE